MRKPFSASPHGPETGFEEIGAHEAFGKRQTSPKPTSRPRGCKFGPELTSGLPVRVRFDQHCVTYRDLIEHNLQS